MKSFLNLVAIFVAVAFAAVTSQAQTVTKVAAGFTHSLFLKSDGSLWAMGNDVVGELGDGKNVNTNRPQLIVTSGVTDIAAGGSHSLFIKSDGSLWTMGFNADGQLGNNTPLINNIYLNTNVPQMVVSSGVKMIAAGRNYSLFIKNDDTVWAMGQNDAGQLGDGNLYNRTNTPQRVAITGVITAMAAGYDHELFLKNDGSLWTCGFDLYGQLGDGTNNSTPPYHTNIAEQVVASGVKAIGAGHYHSLFVKNDGSLWVMGYNNNGQLGDGSTTNSDHPKQILPSGVKAVTGGTDFSLFVKTNGSLWAMGNNNYGQLGDGVAITGSATTNLPEQIVASNVTAVVAGMDHTLFIKSDGSLWGMGASDQGQLGDGIPLNFTNRPELIVGAPAIISGVTKSGTNLVFTGINNIAGSTNYMLMTTDFTLPKNQWTRIQTNILSALGSFTITVTNTVNANIPGRFYLLQMP